MDFEVQGESVTIDYVNVQTVKINYYVTELEILFSKTPFLSQVKYPFFSYFCLQESHDFGFVAPFESE